MRVKGFVEIIVRAFFESQGTLRGFPYLGQQDRRRPYISMAQAAQRLTAIHARHENIQNDQIRMVRLHFLKSRGPIRDHQYFETSAFQKWGKAVDNSVVVICKEEGHPLAGHGSGEGKA